MDDSSIRKLYENHNIIYDKGTRLYKVDFNDKVYRYSFSRPFYLLIDNNRVDVNSWGETLVKIIDFLDKSILDFREKCDEFRPKWSDKRQMISSSNGAKFITSKKTSTGLLVETNTDSLHMVWTMKDLFDYYNINENRFEIRYRRKACDEPKDLINKIEEINYKIFFDWMKVFKKYSEKKAESKIDYFKKVNNLVIKSGISSVPFILIESKQDVINYSSKFIKFIAVRYYDKKEIRQSIENITKLYLEFFNFRSSRNAPDFINSKSLIISSPMETKVFSKTKVVSIQLDDKHYLVDSWGSMIEKSCKHIIKYRKESFVEVYKTFVNDNGLKPFSDDIKKYKRSAQISKRLWVDTSFGANDSVRFIRKLCLATGVDFSKIEHYKKRKYISANDAKLEIGLDKALDYYNKKDIEYMYYKFTDFPKQTLKDSFVDDESIGLSFIRGEFDEFVNFCHENKFDTMCKLLYLPFDSFKVKEKFKDELLKKVKNILIAWLDQLDDAFDEKDIFSDEEIRKLMSED